jgi:uncharacterized alpha-E superfamily protein
MLSRVGDSLYWMSRYLERADHTARLVDVDLQLRLDESPDSGSGRLLRILEALQTQVAGGDRLDPNELGYALTFERSNPSSIVSCISKARENLRHVREQCSSEMWEQLNRLYLQIVTSPKEEGWLSHSHQFFRSVQDGANLFHGLADATMSHGEGFHYIQLGRYVERTDALTRLIGTHFNRVPRPLDQPVESEEYLEWVGLLKCCSAFEAYCKKYTAELRPLRVAEFLLLNPDFPHSVRFSVEMIQSALQIIGELTERRPERTSRLAGRMQATLSFSQIDEIVEDGAFAYVDSVRSQCAQAHAAIHQIYFDYAIESTMTV